MIKNKIKILVIIGFAVLITKSFFVGSTSPKNLTYNIKKIIASNHFINQYFKFKLGSSKNESLAAGYGSILSKSVAAQGKKTVYYNNKKLTFLSDDPNDDTPEFILEYLYQLELQKEKK